MGDIQKPTTRWKKRNVNKPIIKSAEQDSINSTKDDRTEPFITNIVKSMNIGLDKEGNESPSRGNESPSPGKESPSPGKESPSPGKETPSPGKETPSRGNESPSPGKETPSRGNETPSRGNESPFYDLYGGKTSKSMDMTSPFNLTSAPLQTVFDNVLFIDHYKKSAEGFDNVANDTNKNLAKDAFKNAMDFLEKWIFKALEFILIKGPTLMINKITDGICGNDVTPSEKDVVKNYVKEFFVLLITCYITYNWYYIMFFPRKRLEIPLLKISTDNLTNKNKWVSLVFKYLIVPLSLLNSILLKKMPFIIRPFGKKFKFLFLFYFIPKIIMKYGADIARGFLDSIRQKKTKSDGIFIAMMVVFGVTSVLRVRFSINYFSELFRFYSQMAIFFIPILIMFALRIVFSTMNAWIAGILFFGYLLLMSFFAMSIYGKTANFFSVINLIDEYILRKKQTRKPKPCAPNFDDPECARKSCNFNYYDDSGCAPMPILVRIEDYRLRLFDYLFKYKYETVLFVFFVKYLYYFIYYLKSGTRMKQYLMVLTFFGILISLTSVVCREFVFNKDYGNDSIIDEKAELKKARESAMKGCGTRTCAPKLDKSKDFDDDDDFEIKPEISILERLYKTAINDEDDDSDSDEDSDLDDDEKGDIEEVFNTLTQLFDSTDENANNQNQNTNNQNQNTNNQNQNPANSYYVQGHITGTSLNNSEKAATNTEVTPEIAVTNTNLNAAKGLQHV